MMNTRVNTFAAVRGLGMATMGAAIVALAAPAAAQAQERPNTVLADQLDALATDRAQDLNRAYYDYEQQLDEARQEAQRRQQPSYFTDRRQTLRADLEQRVLRVERQYEQRRADLLQTHTGRRWEGGEAENRFEQPKISAAERRSNRTRIAQLNTELAQAWADFHEAGDELRARARGNPEWDGYEAAVTELEREYQQTISRIEEQQRALRFEMAREGVAVPADTVPTPTD